MDSPWRVNLKLRSFRPPVLCIFRSKGFCGREHVVSGANIWMGCDVKEEFVRLIISLMNCVIIFIVALRERQFEVDSANVKHGRWTNCTRSSSLALMNPTVPSSRPHYLILYTISRPQGLVFFVLYDPFGAPLLSGRVMGLDSNFFFPDIALSI